MAKDHFETHYYQKKRVDWNFNVLFTGETDVIRMVNEYAPYLDHPGLYDPIPAEWLHSTILRVGLTNDFSEEEMLKVADVLASKLANLVLPEFIFDSWWLWGGNVVLHITPDEQYREIYNCVIEAMQTVIGGDRMLGSTHGTFIPHVGLAYTKTHHKEREINTQLLDNPVRPATFRATSVSLIRQWPTSGHYEWEIVKDLHIGNM